ncbi:MAG: 7-carboxy-7-deazaguanine synthase QueE [Candidatus Omnitrophota bacterium]|nr:7-carboxy-7-deazaguanine synthase QueE [Candidatus Omnitrophota bacterium]
MNKQKAEIVDIFSSVQGEGVFLGARQVFARFKSCNLECAYCDEPRDGAAEELTSLELMARINTLDESRGPHHSVSLTGGEPLLYADYLKIFLKILKKRKMKSYLETNGTLPYELLHIIDLIDIIAMDFKLPSSTGLQPFWKEHLEFLKIASKKKVFVKVVVTCDTAQEDIEKAVKTIKKVNENIPLVIQPSTPLNLRERALDKETLLKFLDVGLRSNLDNIRVIPQVHKMLGVK